MKLHVLYNTLCTIELVMHIQMSWMKSRERLPVTTADRAGWAGHRAWGGRGVAMHRTVQVRLAYSKAGGREERGGCLEREGGRGLSRYDLNFLTSVFIFKNYYSCLMLSMMNAAFISKQ